MTWKTHIEEITSKMSKSIGIISRTKHILPKYVLHTLYYTMIFPYLHYCNIVWASTYPSRLENITVLQKELSGSYLYVTIVNTHPVVSKNYIH